MTFPQKESGKGKGKNAHPNPILDKLPRILFCGQSNVGKSSLIRKLTGIQVRVGKTPGSTHKIGEFSLQDYVVVDLPGFGFMRKKSKIIREQVKEDIIEYIESRKNVIALALVILSSTTFVEMFERWEERQMITIPVEFGQLFQELEIPFLVLANKIDRLTESSRSSLLDTIHEAFHQELSTDEELPQTILCSAKTGEGLKEIKRVIMHYLGK